MGGMSYPMNLNNQNYQKSLAEELNNVRIQLENAIEQVEWLIGRMEAELDGCDCEDGCCQ